MQTVLVIATHPDDEVLGCGGVMARHAAQGDAVHVLVITRGDPELFSEEEIEATRQELHEAHAILRVASTQFLDFPAPKLDTVPGFRVASAIGAVIDQLRPQIVYVPHRGDVHADHRVVYEATLVACRPINMCPVRRLLSYETLSETEWASPSGEAAFVPTLFVDIGRYLSIKLSAMACYRSQLKPPPHSRTLETLAALATLRGATVSVAAAEAFMLVREVDAASPD